ncbi:MAG TPA: prolyl oligopeptidase family serine peptidase [Gammaproteobacteria bacterium]|nr:prolyl oligopeptidase family serine peptidase [Gammaproteobacteria bacterium]
MRSPVLISIVVLWVAAAAVADKAESADSNRLAAAFGSYPIWGVRLSPDGTQLSLVEMHASGVSMARVVRLPRGEAAPILVGNRDSRDPNDVQWCGWANDSRLICGVRRLGGATQLVAVDDDGANIMRLAGSRVVDWLPNVPDHVLVSVGNPNGLGSVLSRRNVYDRDRTDDLLSGPIQAFNWKTDADGNPRLYLRIYGGEQRWFVRDTVNALWTSLHENAVVDTDDAFAPVGFNEQGNELLFFDRNAGRLALFTLDLDHNRAQRLIYAHESVDVEDVQLLGKSRRPVSVTYLDDRMRFEFLDERVGKIHAALQTRFEGKTVTILDEDWNRRYYLVLVEAADDPGTYYRFDSERDALLELFPARSHLAGLDLAPVREVSYAARDGTRVPAYLTMPSSRGTQLPPAVVLPHDGPDDRDYLRFDFLAQYLAASGYVVLQSNYRGSSGYGVAWSGQGGYRDWRRAIGDVAAGTEYLARAGLADPKRICIVGWGYGGYAALLSAVEDAALYRCVVSIAGVTDPRTYGSTYRGYVGGAAERAFVGTDGTELDAGSPLKRASEIKVPVLLFHGKRDGDVLPKQSADLAKSLQRAGRDCELVEYEYAEHDFRADRVDLLTRLGDFLAAHLAK